MEGNVTCSLCKLESAESFCVCSNLPTFCPTCRAIHETKPGFHFALSMAGRRYVNSQNQSQYMVWLLCLTNSQAKLRENIQRIEQCREEIEALHVHIQAELDTLKNQLLQTLEELKAALSLKIEESIRETTAYAYEDYQPSSALAALVWTHSCQQSSEPIVTFAYQVNTDIDSLQGLMEVSFQTTLPELSQYQYQSGRSSLKQEIADLQGKLAECNLQIINLTAQGHEKDELLSLAYSPASQASVQVISGKCHLCKATFTERDRAWQCERHCYCGLCTAALVIGGNRRECCLCQIELSEDKYSKLKQEWAKCHSCGMAVTLDALVKGVDCSVCKACVQVAKNVKIREIKCYECSRIYSANADDYEGIKRMSVSLQRSACCNFSLLSISYKKLRCNHIVCVRHAMGLKRCRNCLRVAELVKN